MEMSVGYQNQEEWIQQFCLIDFFQAQTQPQLVGEVDDWIKDKEYNFDKLICG